MATTMKVAVPRRTDETSVLTRWNWVWAFIGILVMAVVIAFLMGIVSALQSIDSALGVADHAVGGAGNSVVPLPQHIAHVNATLGSIGFADERPSSRKTFELRRRYADQAADDSLLQL